MTITKKKINLAELKDDSKQLIKAYYSRKHDQYTDQWIIDDIVYQLACINSIIRGNHNQIENLDYYHLI